MRNQHGNGVAARGHVADRVGDPLFGQRVERRGGLVEDEQVRSPQQGPGDRQPLLLAPRHLDAAFADHRVETAVRTREQIVAGRLPQHVEALGV